MYGIGYVRQLRQFAAAAVLVAAWTLFGVPMIAVLASAVATILDAFGQFKDLVPPILIPFVDAFRHWPDYLQLVFLLVAPLALTFVAWRTYPLTIAAQKYFIDARRHRNTVRANELFVSVELTRDSEGEVSGRIVSKTDWTAWTRAKGESFPLKPETAAGLQNFLPRIYQLQHESGGLIRADGVLEAEGLGRWASFTPIRQRAADTMRAVASFTLFSIAVALAVLVAVERDTWNWAFTLAALAAVTGLTMLVRTLHIESIAKGLSVRVTFRKRNGIADMLWYEYVGIGLGFHGYWSVLHDDQGVAEFCKRVLAMKVTSVSLDWRVTVRDA